MEDSAEASSSPIGQGCGPAAPAAHISVQISPTTGGDFHLSVEPDTTVDNLKKLVSKKLKVPRDRLCLLFRDKQLQDGNLLQHGVADGSKVTLLPNVETGLVTQRPEIGIMQALESLNDTQVNEFLCGKAPLNLSMRLGDHMMLIQLQLSTMAGAKHACPASAAAAAVPSPPSPPPPAPSPVAQQSQQAATSSSQSPSRPPSLIQASRNLQHTLRKLSADVFSGREEGRRGSVYSGTFSGALNPALQDPRGRPRRDVATIVHILNDLLCSAPDLRRVGRRSVDEAAAGASATSSASSSSSSSAETAASSAVDAVADEPMLMMPTSSGNSDDQNLRTRGKLEHLRLVMGERRERRKQRKRKPYALPHAAQTDNTDTVTA